MLVPTYAVSSTIKMYLLLRQQYMDDLKEANIGKLGAISEQSWLSAKLNEGFTGVTSFLASFLRLPLICSTRMSIRFSG